MGVYDQAARFAAQADPALVPMRLLASSGASLNFQGWFDTRTIPLPGGRDRTADLVADLQGEQKRWLIVLEFQAQEDVDKIDVPLEEIARLRCRARYGDDHKSRYNVLAGLVYLTGRVPQDVLDMTLPNGVGTRHATLSWNVAEDDAVATLEAIGTGTTSWGMLFWVPSMRGADAADVIARWRAMVEERIPDRRIRGELAGVATIFAEAAGRVLAWKKGLEDFDMTESQVVNEWIQQGDQRAQLRERREDLLLLLQGRFPNEVSEDIARVIQEQDAPELLRAWFLVAIRASSFEQFLTALRG